MVPSRRNYEERCKKQLINEQKTGIPAKDLLRMKGEGSLSDFVLFVRFCSFCTKFSDVNGRGKNMQYSMHKSQWEFVLF